MILHHWWIILIRCCNFCQQDRTSWCDLFLVRSLFRSRFQNENSVKGKATMSWRGIFWTHTSLPNSNVTPTGSVLSSWQSLGFALKTQSFKPFNPLSTNIHNWPQLDSTTSSRTSQNSRSHPLDFVLLLLAALTGGSEFSCRHNGCEHIKRKTCVKSVKEPMFIKRGWTTFCRPEISKHMSPESYLCMGPWRLCKTITRSTARSKLEMEATASKYM